MKQKDLGECSCLDFEHKENILNNLRERISSYDMEIADTTMEERKLRSKGDIAMAERADYNVKRAQYYRNNLSETLQAVNKIKNCVVK